MAQTRTRKRAPAKKTLPEESVTETVATKTPDEISATKPKPPEPVKAKAAEPKDSGPIDKWNKAKLLLMKTFPVFRPGELDIINCSVDDMKIHVEYKLSLTREELEEIIPGY